MGKSRYTDEFKKEAVTQIVGRGYSVKDVAERIGVSTHSLYKWLHADPRNPKSQKAEQQMSAQEKEIQRLQSELRRATEERDILKKAAAFLRKSVRVRYVFIKSNRTEFRIVSMCRVLKVHRSGFYAWLNKPKSARQIEDERILKQIKHFWDESDKVYGSPRIFEDLRESGEVCGLNRVARIMRENKIQAEIGLKRRRYKYGKPSVTHENHLQQNFSYDEIDVAWVTDITYIPTSEGWLYLAVVMDLCSRRIVGWSMQNTLHRDIVVQALLSAFWRRRPKNKVIIHSDQGTQYSSDDWNRFCKNNNFIQSMSRRGNCYDNAAVESFFNSLKKERTRRRKYLTREEARNDIFDYIEVFYNRKRRHEHLNRRSPVDFEKALMAS
ncbi:MAG: IS3 family transposase [Spirochaetales bacterium]|uniref:IS3 family transposase n=1 Tax=Candidatus Thalassospirochaeta sargassi TaxID=3119039 RepID=A0AAJ1ID79_9SPIO|nr:IS3 family transposase [Spirochaetales bacterium]